MVEAQEHQPEALAVSRLHISNYHQATLKQQHAPRKALNQCKSSMIDHQHQHQHHHQVANGNQLQRANLPGTGSENTCAIVKLEPGVVASSNPRKQQSVSKQQNRCQLEELKQVSNEGSSGKSSSIKSRRQQQQQQQQQIIKNTNSKDTLIGPVSMRDKATLSNICAGCSRPIREQYLLEALDKRWHEDCLKCACCECRLGEVGSSLFLHLDKIFCRRDFLRIFGQRGQCALCAKSIEPYELVMRAKGHAFHIECFACQQCQARFCVGDQFCLWPPNKIVCLHCHQAATSNAATLTEPEQPIPVEMLGQPELRLPPQSGSDHNNKPESLTIQQATRHLINHQNLNGQQPTLTHHGDCDSIGPQTTTSTSTTTATAPATTTTTSKSQSSSVNSSTQAPFLVYDQSNRTH